MLFVFRCDCVYHTGMTCQFYQIYKTDNDHSLRVSRGQSVWKYYQNSTPVGLDTGRSFKQKTLPSVSVPDREERWLSSRPLHQVSAELSYDDPELF